MKADDETADKIASNTDLTALEDFGSITVIDILSETAGTSGKQFVVEVGVPESVDLFGQVNTRAVTYAKDRAGELISELEESTRNDIRDTIAAGLEDGLSVGQLSDKLEEMYSFSSDRAGIIASQELNNAANQGVLAGMKELRDQGAEIEKAWNPDDTACLICLANADEGFIGVDDDFDNDGDPVDAPPGHVRCRCNLISKIKS